jgi:hypothetical protein
MKKEKLFAACLIGMCLSFAVGCGDSSGSGDVNTASADAAQESVDDQNVEQETDVSVEEPVQEEPVQEEKELQEETFWDEVGIKDGIATVYNGDTVALTKSEDGRMEGSYYSRDAAPFSEYSSVDITYNGAEVQLSVPQSLKCVMQLSGDYETEKSGKGYDWIVGGETIGWFKLADENTSTSMDDELIISKFKLYPVEGLVMNGYEFQDTEMENVVNYFGTPDDITFIAGEDTSEDEIYYYYETGMPDLIINGEYYEDVGSMVRFYTKDGKHIEEIYISLSLREEDYVSSENW